MPSFRSHFPSKYLKADDLNGRPALGTIARVVSELIGADKNPKPVCYFTETSLKPFVLNLTNSVSIAAIAGTEDTDEWPGTKVVLFPTSTFFQGKDTPCIRVRAPKLKPAVVAPKVVDPPALTEQESPDDDVPSFGIQDSPF